MAKEWEKFQAEYKKLKAAYPGHRKDNAETTSQRLRLANANCTEGEANLRSALVAARKDGIAGNTLGDMARSPKVKEAINLLGVAARTLDEEIARVDKFAADAATALTECQALKARIEKDLKSRKDSSESKKDIEALLADLEADIKAFGGFAKFGKDKVSPYHRGYTAGLKKTMDKIVAEAPDAQKSQVEGNEVPQKLTDRVLNKYLTRCVGAMKEVQDACDKAIDAAGKGKAADAQNLLKQAAVTAKEIRAIAQEYQGILKDHASALEISKDKSKILSSVDKMTKADEAAQRILRGVTTTMRKAG